LYLSSFFLFNGKVSSLIIGSSSVLKLFLINDDDILDSNFGLHFSSLTILGSSRYCLFSVMSSFLFLIIRDKSRYSFSSPELRLILSCEYINWNLFSEIISEKIFFRLLYLSSSLIILRIKFSNLLLLFLYLISLSF